MKGVKKMRWRRMAIFGFAAAFVAFLIRRFKGKHELEETEHPGEMERAA